MADPVSGNPTSNDPLGDRLRTTLRAEAADIERRQNAAEHTPRRSQPARWIPFAAAAAIIAIAGFFLLGNRTNDRAVDLEVAGQTQESDNSPAPAPVSPEPALARPLVGEIPHISGENYCFEPAGEDHPLLEGTMIVWAAGGPVPAAIAPFAGQDPPLSRTLPSGTRVTLEGGCTRSATPDDDIVTWYEIAGPVNDWVRTEFLITEAEFLQRTGAGSLDEEPFYHTVQSGDRLGAIASKYNVTVDAIIRANPQMNPSLIVVGERILIPGAATSEEPQPEPTEPTTRTAINDCGVEIEPLTPRFVWRIDVDDPDGGLVAHVAPGVDAPVTRVIPANGVVFLSGGCARAPSGTPWFELLSDNGFEWVSGNFLVTPIDACLFGEAFGSPRPGEEADQQLFGPAEGGAFEVGDVIAFSDFSADTYRFYGQASIGIGVPCYLTGSTGPICLTGDYRIVDFRQPEPIDTDRGPTNAERTGRTYASPDRRGLAEELIEITLVGSAGDRLVGFFDPVVTDFSEDTCAGVSQDPFAERPCAIDEGTPLESFGSAGSEDSQADHVHDIQVQQIPGCTRIVVEFGTGAFTASDVPALVVPPIEVAKASGSTRVRFPTCTPPSPCSPFAGVVEPDRVDFEGGTVFIGIGEDHQPYLQILHGVGLSSVTLLDSPARVVFDWQTRLAAIGDGPLVLSDVILTRSVNAPVNGPAMTQPTGRAINGWARPFEALGQWYVFSLPPSGELSSTPTAVASGPMATTAWIDGWGEFTMTLPDLDEGDYLVAFGESPPADGPNFVGSAQRIRVSNATEPGTPLGDTFIDDFVVTGPILILD